jgi:very-short-patch-repair endonuclease
MRRNLLRKNTTKQERVVHEILKELKLPFRHRWLINGREIDFVIGRLCIEIDGHEQNSDKNLELIQLGYVPIHFSNREITNNRQDIKAKIINYGSYTSNAS